MDLIKQCLIILKRFAMSDRGAALDIKEGDVQWVLTVPAIWTDFGKAFMRTAAHRAGLIPTEQSDDLMLVLEPEAAAVAVQPGLMEYDILERGSQFLVLDCGGGVTDITVHEVEAVIPALQLKTIAIPSGGAWGGDDVNAMFKKFLRRLLTESYCEEQEKEQMLMLSFDGICEKFDRIKADFGPRNEPEEVDLSYVLPSRGALAGLVQNYNAHAPPNAQLGQAQSRHQGFFRITPELLRSFHEPVLEPIVEATRAALNQHSGIRFIVVVGGFGSNHLVHTRIFNEFDGKNGIRCLLPTANPSPQAAIAYGGVLFGLHGSMVTSRLSPHTNDIGANVDRRGKKVRGVRKGGGPSYR